MNRVFRALGRRNALIAALGVVVVAGGSGVGIYLQSRAHQPLQQSATRNVGAAPTAVPVGVKTVGEPKQAVILSVLGTKPVDGTAAVPLESVITLGFNLPVNPASVSSFLTIMTSNSPTVPGTMSQGKSPQEVVFKPSAKFDFGTSVNVALRTGLKSLDGAELNNDFSFKFTTVADPRTVLFMANYQQSRLVNAASGRPLSMQLQVGGAVPNGTSIRIFKATARDLLAALVYSSTTGYADKPIDTSLMKPVDSGASLTASGARTSKVITDDEVTVLEPDGLYLVVAADANGQYGAVWVNFSRYGILLRQDDQRVIVAGEDMTTGATTPTFNITFYNLLNGVHPKLSGTFSGAAEFPAKLPSGFDVAVATSGGEEVVVPMSAPESGADIKVAGDLGQLSQVFVTTDRPAYQKGELVRFAGMARLSNDQSYALKSGMKVALWTQVTAANLAVATVAADGSFAGSFAIPVEAFGAGGTDQRLPIFAGPATADRYNPNVAVYSTEITILSPHAPTATLSVSLDKASYVAGEPVVATIAGLNSKGQALAGQTVTVSVYSTQHIEQPAEMDSFPTHSSWGDPIADNASVRLDTAGHATYAMAAKLGLKAADQEFTVVARYGTGKTQAVAARSAIFFQAADDVFLLPSRSSYRVGDPLAAPFVVETRSGSRVASATLAYELDRTDYQGDQTITTVVGSGTVTADANGRGTIRAAYSGTAASLVLRIKGKDAGGNVFQDATYVNVGQGINGSGQDLDVSGDKVAYQVGDSANFTVTSPANISVLLSLERGRVHQYRWVSLVKGDNALAVNVTPDLAPGFTVAFSYFRDGVYTTYGYPVYVNNSNRLLKVTVTADKAGYAKGQVAQVTIAVTDSAGAPVAATVIGDGYDAHISAFKLVDQDSIAGAFLRPNRLGTNASSSLVGIGTYGGGCGGGYNLDATDAMYAGRTPVWLPALATDPTGHRNLTLTFTQSGAMRLVVMAGTAASGWGQAEIDLNVA